MPDVTIGFVPRERFSFAPEALERILQCTNVPFNLVVVDCATPQIYWQPIEKILRGRENVKIIRKNRHLLPNQCRNLVLPEADGEFLCFIENDNLVQEDWISLFLESIEKHSADVVIPLLFEGRPGTRKVHFDEDLGEVRIVQTTDGEKWKVVPRPGRKENDVGGQARPQEFMETHCLFFRRRVFDRIGPFDEEINASDEVDLSLALYNAGVPAVFDPRCIVHYIPPTFPVSSDDREYFLLRWDIELANQSHKHIQRKWNLVRVPQLLGWFEERNLRGSGRLRVWREELASLVSDRAFILVDLEQWNGSEIVDGLRNIPFLERDGQYWGSPADDDTAIQELERLKQSGASMIVFAWHAFWYFNYYSHFYDHLCSKYTRVLENEHIVAFDLWQKP
jgi:GT2 family glycosyltransferase